MIYLVCTFNNNTKKSELRLETRDYNEAIILQNLLKAKGEITFIDYSNE